MQASRFQALATTGTLFLITGNAMAMYTGLSVTLQRVTLQDGTMMNRYRVYGYCTDPNDYFVQAAGGPNVGNLIIQSRNADDSGEGSVLYNAPGGGATSPTAAAVALNQDLAHDTFVTVGVPIADWGSGPAGRPDQTWLSPGFTGFGSVNQINTNNAAWFHPRVEQGRAGYLGDGDPLLRVLVMQLTVTSTSNVRGTVAISGINQIALGGAQSFTVSGQTFNSIPAGGVLPLLGLAALIGRRRRRSSVCMATPHNPTQDNHS